MTNRRAMTGLVALVVAFGNGQTWLLHAHDEHAWHAHAIDLAGGIAPAGGDSETDDNHGHDESLPSSSLVHGIVVILKSGPAIAGSGPGAAQPGPGYLHVGIVPASTKFVSSPTADALPQRHCAHKMSSFRTVESLLCSNHALLI